MAGVGLTNRYDRAAPIEKGLVTSPSPPLGGLSCSISSITFCFLLGCNGSFAFGPLNHFPCCLFRSCTLCLGSGLGSGFGGQSRLPRELPFLLLSGGFALARTRCPRCYDMRRIPG
jgi:hypothetical protein